MDDQREKEQTWNEILYWGLALVGLVGVKQLWTVKLRPWIEATWGEIRAGNRIGIPLFGTVDILDVVGFAVLATLALVGMLASRAKRRIDARNSRASTELDIGHRLQGASGGRRDRLDRRRRWVRGDW